MTEPNLNQQPDEMEWTVEYDNQGYQRFVCNGEDVTNEIGKVSHTDLEPIAEAHNQALATQREKYEREIAELWKESALSVMPPYREIGRALNLTLADSVHDKILPSILTLRAELASAQEQIASLRDALLHMQICGNCAESSWEECDGGRDALSALAQTEAPAK